MEEINCYALESDRDVSKLGLEELCNEVSFLKPLNVPAWRPEFVAATRKDEVLVVGMVEHKRSCNKMEEAIKQVFGKDFWKLLLKSQEDAKCLTYLSTIGPLFSLFAVAKAEKVSGKCCLPINGIKTFTPRRLTLLQRGKREEKGLSNGFEVDGFGCFVQRDPVEENGI